MKKRMVELGFALSYASSEEFGNLVVGDYQRYGAVIRGAGIQPN